MEYFEHAYDVFVLLGDPKVSPLGKLPDRNRISPILEPLWGLCRGTPGTRGDQDRYFETWAPSWSACKKDGKPPDLFFSMTGQGGPEPGFHPIVVLALAFGLGETARQMGQEAALCLGDLVKSLLSVKKNRPWGYAWEEGGGFTGSVQDLSSTGLFKPDPHGRRPGPDMFEEEWDIL